MSCSLTSEGTTPQAGNSLSSPMLCISLHSKFETKRTCDLSPFLSASKPFPATKMQSWPRGLGT